MDVRVKLAEIRRAVEQARSMPMSASAVVNRAELLEMLGGLERAMDVLFPGIGEIIGGSQREENYEKLAQRIREMGLHEEELWWYLDTRRFGTVPHAGFGLGFERMVQFVTGMGNIRDVIAFPRTPKNAEF